MKYTKKNNRKGGRPKKGLAEKLSYRVSVKLCTEDYYKLIATAKTAGLNKTELVRQVIKGCKISRRLSLEQMDWIRKLSGMANNLNQIARQANRAGYANIRDEYLKLAPRIDDVITLIEDDGKNS